MSQRRRKIGWIVLATRVAWSVCGPSQLAFAKDESDPPPTREPAPDPPAPASAPETTPQAGSSTLRLARELFRQGSALAEGAHWDAAHKAYDASFALFPHATTLHNIAYCQWRQGALSAAWYATTRAIEGKEFPADRRLSDARRAVAKQQQAALRAELAVVRLITVVPNLQVHVDGQPLISPGSSPLGPFVRGATSATPAEPVLVAGAELLLEPGSHEVLLEVAGARQTYSLDLASGESTLLGWQQTPQPPVVTAKGSTNEAGVAAPEAAGRRTAPASSADHRSAANVPAVHTAKSQGPASTSAGSLRTYGTVAAWSVAGLGLTTAAVAGGIAISANASLEKQCTDRQCPPSASEDVSRYETSIRWVNAGLIVGGLGALAGVVLKVTAAPRGVSSNTSVRITSSGVALVRDF